MITIGNVEIPHKTTEITIGQLNKVNEILQSNRDTIEKWYDVFISLGAIESDINDLDFDEFKQKIKEFNDSENKDIEIIKEIKIDGYTYSCYDTEFRLSIKDLKVIEKVMAIKPNTYLADLLAILYKRTDLTDAEHYDSAHLKHKAKLFNDLKANIGMPVIYTVAKKVIESKDVE